MTAFSILDRRTRRQDPFFLFRWACWSLHCGLQRCWWSQEGRITVEDPDPSHVFQPSSQWCPDCLHHSDQPGFAETMVKALCHSPAVCPSHHWSFRAPLYLAYRDMQCHSASICGRGGRREECTFCQHFRTNKLVVPCKRKHWSRLGVGTLCSAGQI